MIPILRASLDSQKDADRQIKIPGGVQLIMLFTTSIQ